MQVGPSQYDVRLYEDGDIFRFVVYEDGRPLMQRPTKLDSKAEEIDYVRERKRLYKACYEAIYTAAPKLLEAVDKKKAFERRGDITCSEATLKVVMA